MKIKLAPFPKTWARKEGSGRVFYTAMGHREDIWTNAAFKEMLTGGLRWALDEVKAQVPPNLSEVAPHALTNPPYIEPPPPKPAR